VSATFAIALFVVVSLGIATVWLFPDGSERFIQGLLFLRRIVFGLGAILLGLFLLYTGAGSLMFIGGIIILLIVIYLLQDPEDLFGVALPWE